MTACWAQPTGIVYRWVSFVFGPSNLRGSAWRWVDDFGKQWRPCEDSKP